MKYKESLAHFLVFITSKNVIITAVTVIALIILHPFFMRTIERMKMSSVHDIMQRIALSQTNYEISNNHYADDFKDLDIKLKDKYGKYFEDDSVQINNFTLLMARRGLLASQDKGEYFVYYDYKQSAFSCAPREHYICKNINPISKDICEEAGMFWSVRNNSCYTREKDMCLALGMPWYTKGSESFCGYKNIPGKRIYESAACVATTPSGCQGSIVYDGGTCEGKGSFGCMQSSLQGGTCIAHTDTSCHSVQVNKGSTCLVNDDYSGSYGCQNVTINKGGICLAVGSNTLACNKATVNNGGICRGYANKSCNQATVLGGGICEANAQEACQEITVNKGGRCIANVPQTCEGTYETGACCHGDYCPAEAPKCNCPGFAKIC